MIYQKGYVTWTKKNARNVYFLNAHRYEIELENSTAYAWGRFSTNYQ